MDLPASYFIRSMVKKALPFLALLVLVFAGSASAQTTKVSQTQLQVGTAG